MPEGVWGRSKWKWAVSFISMERAHSTHWKGGWMGPRASLDVLGNGEIISQCQDSNSGSSSP